MKAKYLFLTLFSFSACFLVGCSDNRYAQVVENCKIEYIRSLPEGDKRDNLMEWCMTSR